MSEHYDAEEIVIAICGAYQQGRADAVKECVEAVEKLRGSPEMVTITMAIAVIRKVGG